MSDFATVWIAAKANTVFGEQRSRVFYDLASRARGAEGDIAVLGVWRGGSALVAAGALPGRRLHLFDTFRGYPHNGRFGAGDPLGDTEQLLREIPHRCYAGVFPETAVGFTAPLALAHID